MFKEPDTLPKQNPESGIEARDMIISEMEQLLGSRNKNFTLDAKIYYYQNGPMVSAPKNLKNWCVVILSPGSEINWSCFMYEMAHEAVHLLDPREEPASYLEEGIAVWFSLHMCKKYGYRHKQPTGQYKKAFEWMTSLPDEPPVVVKKVRSAYSNLTDITADQLRLLYPEFPIREATSLTQKMTYKRK